MKKYDLSKIMKRAWELVKKMGLSISEGLKKAWREVKTMYKSQVELFEREQEIKSRKRELNNILKNSDEWSVRRPSPEIAMELKKLSEELEQIKKDRRSLPALTYYVAVVESGEIIKATVDNAGRHYYSAKIRAIVEATGNEDWKGHALCEYGEADAFESEKQAKDFIKAKTRKVTEEDLKKWHEKVDEAQKMIVYDEF